MQDWCVLPLIFPFPRLRFAAWAHIGQSRTKGSVHPAGIPADKALYKAKASGRNEVVVAHAALDGEGASETPVVERHGY